MPDVIITSLNKALVNALDHSNVNKHGVYIYIYKCQKNQKLTTTGDNQFI